MMSVLGILVYFVNAISLFQFYNFCAVTVHKIYPVYVWWLFYQMCSLSLSIFLTLLRQL